jgi:peptidoglycan/LPS O-acetylase OafA/YrhL
MLLLSLLWAVAVIYNQPDLLNNSMMDILVGDQKRDLGFYYMEYLYVLPQARFPSFYCGLLAAWLWVNHQEVIVSQMRRNRSVLLMVTVVSLAGAILIASYDVFKPASDFNDFDHAFHGINMVAGRFIFSLLITLLIIISLARVRGGQWIGRFFSLPIFYPIAKVSYSMYLFHPPFLFLSFFLIFGKDKIETLSVANLLLLASMGILFSFIFGVITYYLVERRFTSKNIRQRLREKFAT